MSNELVPQDIIGGDIVPYDFNEISSGASTFLPRLQLFGSKSNACAEGKIPIGHWGLVTEKDNIIDLGEEIDIILLAWRPKALLIDGENTVNAFDPDTELFKEIKSKSDIKDSGCMSGPEFLIWVPEQEIFASLYMASKTAKREGRRVKMNTLIGKAITLKARLIKTQKYTWHGPVVVPCSLTLDVPAIEDIKLEINKFKNPPEIETLELADNQSDRVL